MGEPVKITDLAETMIRLSGKEPGTDVAIEFVGARPGEKLHEELWSETENVIPSEHEAIMLVTRPPIDRALARGRARRARPASSTQARRSSSSDASIRSVASPHRGGVAIESATAPELA